MSHFVLSVINLPRPWPRLTRVQFCGHFRAGLERLAIFVSERLSKYEANRNNPNVDVLSGLSFWANFGQISMQRCIMYAKENGKGHAKVICENLVFDSLPL